MENDFFVQSNKLYIRTFYLAHYSWFMISKLALIIYPTKAVAKDYGFFPILLDECQLGGLPSRCVSSLPGM